MRQVEGLSVVSDLDHGRIVELLDGRSRRRVERYLHSLLQRGRKATGVVSIDPHEGYRYALRNETPGHAGPLLGCVHHARRQDLHVGQGHFALKQDLDFRYLRQDVDRSLRARLRGLSTASLGGIRGPDPPRSPISAIPADRRDAADRRLAELDLAPATPSANRHLGEGVRPRAHSRPET
jgi:Transposase